MARFFVNRPIVAMVISIITVLLGVVAMSGLPISQYPEVVPPMIQVTTTFVGASATDVEASVATPLEQKINGVENMIYMKSTNANDGTLTLKVSFEVGSNLDMNNVLTQNRVSEGMPQMPQSVKNYGVSVKKALSFPLMVISVNAWMNHPSGFRLSGGEAVDVDPVAALFGNSYLWHEVIHMYLAAYIVAGFLVAGAPPIWPAGLSWFWAAIAFAMSGTVRPSRPMRSGRSHTRIA